MNLPSEKELRELPRDGGPNYNRLVFEKSPYLLQHARNPVDWFPWGKEAFEKAKAEDKPVFLSVGYATCHWCHVMERESFEDSTVAALLNEHFVAVKVDREERPDIDQIYMTATQAMTGQGGWPMTVVMTWDGKPFFAGTYFPKYGRYGRMGMMELLPSLADAWKQRRGEVLQSAQQITNFLQTAPHRSSQEAVPESVIKGAADLFTSQFDPINGGFGSAPKFPTPHNLLFLLRYWKRSGLDSVLIMVERTLRAMQRGGIYDHVGFGFHRYSTDARWFVPHFEKMLYDQALLSMAYTEAFQITGKTEYREAAEQVLEYVLRDMTDTGGGFHSAEDADSEGMEGKFYTWSAGEIQRVLGTKDARVFFSVYNVSDEGNYFDEATRQPAAVNILHRTKDWDVLAAEAGLSESDLMRTVESARKKMFNVRNERMRPLKDDKVLTDWNGLMIAALARAAAIFEEPRYLRAAERAADFVWVRLRDSQGRLLKRYRQGQAGLPAHVDDYAMMVWGLIELYESSFDLKHLDRAIALTKLQIEHYWDPQDGAFFFTADDGEPMIARMKESYDGALPSGNSVSALNLIRLSRMTGNESWADMADTIGLTFAPAIKKMPIAYAQYLCALDFALGPSYEIVVVGREDAEDTRRMIKVVRQHLRSTGVILLKTPDQAKRLTEIAPFTEAQYMLDDRATIYICQNFTCKRPITDIEEARRALE